MMSANNGLLHLSRKRQRSGSAVFPCLDTPKAVALQSETTALTRKEAKQQQQQKQQQQEQKTIPEVKTHLIFIAYRKVLIN